MIHRSLPQRRGQRGISLIVSLVLLVMVTVVALASVRSVTLQTRMSAANQDRNLAFQAAETAMREAEDLAWANANSLVPASGFPAATWASMISATGVPFQKRT